MSAINPKRELYIHLDTRQSAAELRGVFFYEWMQAFDIPKHLLFLTNPFGQANINLHTYLEFWEREDLEQFLQVPKKVDTQIAWTDFKNEEQLNNLTPQEVAELLYLGHRMLPLHHPFIPRLGNSFVFLSREDGEQATIFMKEPREFYTSLGIVLSNRLSHLKLDATLLGIKRKRQLPPVPATVLQTFESLLSEGVLLDLDRIDSTRGKIEIPLFLVGEEDNIVQDEQSIRGKIIFDRKAKEWMAFIL